MRSLRILLTSHCFSSYCKLDPSAAPPSVFRLARTKSGWRAGAPTKIRLAAAPNFSGGGGGIRRQLVSVHIKIQIK